MDWNNLRLENIADFPDDGPDKVLILRGEITKPGRGGTGGRPRTIPYKIYYPENRTREAQNTTARLPVILWSHGLGGSRDGAGFLGRFLAAYGYILIHLTHPGTDTSLWEGRTEHPWDVIRATHIPRRTTLDRFYDISLIIENLEEIESAHENIRSALDHDRIGMSGHSFGALTTQIACGQYLGAGKRRYRLDVPHIRAGLACSPTHAYNGGEPPDTVYNGIRTPFFCMTGTHDDSPLSGQTYESRLPIYTYAGSPEKYLLVLNGADHMVFAGSRGQLPAYDGIKDHRKLIQIFSLAFWDTYLKDDTLARQWLASAREKIKSMGRYEHRRF